MRTFQLPANPIELAWIGGKGYGASEAPFVYNNKLYWCGVTDSGHFRICQLDLATEAFVTTVITRTDNLYEDDHNSGGLVLGADGHILYTVKGHGGTTPQYLLYGRSTSPEDITSFTERSYDLTTTGGYSSGEYASMFRLSSTGRTYIFGRRYIPTEDPLYPDGGHPSFAWVCHGYSDDDFATALTFTGDHYITYGTIGGAQPTALNVGSNGVDRLYFGLFQYAGTASDQTPANTSTVYYMEMDENGVFYNAAGDAIGYDLDTLDTSGIPTSAMSAVSAQENGYSASVIQVFHDELDRPTVVWQKTAIPASAAPYLIYVSTWTGAAWSTVLLAETGGTVNSDGSANGSLGIIDEDDPKTAYVSVDHGSGHWEIDRYTTTDHSAWVFAESLTAADTSLSAKLLRPAVANGHGYGRPIVLFTEYTDRTSLQSWDGFARIYDLTPVTATADADSINLAWDDLGAGSVIVQRRVVTP